MGKKGRRKASQQEKSVKSAWRRYGFWISGVVLAITVVVIVIIASQGGGNRSTSSTSPTISPSEIPRTSPGAVKAKLDAGFNLVIVDTRSKAEYEQAHVAGAISIPLETLTQRYRELNGYNEIVTYCT